MAETPRSSPLVPLSRSEQMSRIRGTGTRPEMLLSAALADKPHAVNCNVDGVRADVVFPTTRTVVFIDGCFWHGCPDHYVRPRSNAMFWATKLAGNVERDRRQTLDLEGRGWRVVRLWEHDVFEDTARAADTILSAADSSSSSDIRVIRVEVVSESPLLERRVLARLRTAEVVGERIGPRVTAKWRRPRVPTSPTRPAAGGE